MRNEPKMNPAPNRDNHLMGIGRADIDFIAPPPPPPPPPPVENVIVKPIVPAEVSSGKPSRKTQIPLTSARSFNIASLQQYTSSFSQENLIGGGMLGSVYRAQLPNGKVRSFTMIAVSFGNLFMVIERATIFYLEICCIIILILLVFFTALFLLSSTFLTSFLSLCAPFHNCPKLWFLTVDHYCKSLNRIER